MRAIQLLKTSLPPIWLRLPILVVLLLGIYFRFVHLDQKPYWHDETYTSLRISGYKAAEALPHLFTGQVISVKELLTPYQVPNADRSLLDTYSSLATEDPHHPPLYYTLQWVWTRWFGGSVLTIRTLSALLSLLEFPILYWLCLELFQSSLVGWIAVMLFAVSPIYVRYAQEARQYSLWITLMFLSCIALVRAFRHSTVRNWSFYILTTLLGLYCHVFHGFVLIGQAMYGLAIALHYRTRSGLAFLLSLSLIMLAYSPWLWVIYTNWARLMTTTDWTKQALPIGSLLRIWSVNLSHVFLSFGSQANGWLMYAGWAIAVLVAVALYRLCRETPPQTWLLILMIMAVPFFILAVPDLVLGGQRSTSDRYLFPTVLGLSLAVYFLLGSRFLQHKFWQILTLGLVTLGVISCAINSQAETWWQWSEYDVQSARLINQAVQPLVISDMPVGEMWALGHGLKPDVKLLLLDNTQPLVIPKGFQTIFLFNPSPRLKLLAEEKTPLQQVYQFQDNLLIISLYQMATPFATPVHPAQVVYTNK